MGALSKFLGSPKEIEVCGEKIIIHPLTVKNMKLFTKEKPTEEEMQLMATQILKLSIPDSTDEEIEGLSMEAFIQIMDEINKLNGFKDERLDAIKAKIAGKGK